MVSSIDTIKKFIGDENYILKISSENNGKKKLSNVKKNLWSFIAVKILKLESYQLKTIINFVKEHQISLNNLFQDNPTTIKKFYEKLNDKVGKYNVRHITIRHVKCKNGERKIQITNKFKKIFKITHTPAVQNLKGNPLKNDAQVPDPTLFPLEFQNFIDGKGFEENDRATKSKLLQFAKILSNHPDEEVRQKHLPMILEKVKVGLKIHGEVEELFSEHLDSLVTLFPEFDEKMKTTILALALRMLSEPKDLFDNLFQKASKETFQVWENAFGRKNTEEFNYIVQLEYEQLMKNLLYALPVNYLPNLANNKYFRSRDLLENLFSKDEVSKEKQLSFLKNTDFMKFEAFKDCFFHDYTEVFNNFIKALELLDDKERIGKILYTIVERFSSYNYFYLNRQLELLTLIPSKLLKFIPVDEKFEKNCRTLSFNIALIQKQLKNPDRKAKLVELYNSIYSDEIEFEQFVKYFKLYLPNYSAEWIELFLWINENCDPKYHKKLVLKYMEERKNTAELAHFIRILPFNMIDKYVFLNLTIKEVSALIIDFGIVQLIPLFFIHRFYKDLDSIFDEIDFTQLEPKHEKFIFHYFDYIEKEPFKLLNLIINKKYFEKRDFYEPNMHKWLKYHKERYAKCIKFYDEYVILIRFLLEFMNNTEIINLFYQLSDDLQEIILMYARQTVSEPVKTHYWTTSLQLIALWDAMTRKDIQLEIARQINIIDVYQPGMRDILDMIDQAERLRNHEIAQEIVKDFLKPFNYVRQNQVSFSGLYNNPQFSDMTIETENDILKVHRVILRTVPRLHKYFLNKGPHIILKGKKTAKVKQLIKLAYDCFHFEEFIYPNIPKLLHRSFL